MRCKKVKTTAKNAEYLWFIGIKRGKRYSN